MQYKGTFTDIFAALKAFPKGAGDDDFVVISGKIHRWSKHKGTFVTDTVHAPEMPDNNPCITLFTSLTNSGILTDYMGNRWQLAPYVERIAVPEITVTDITQDVYPYTTYPMMQNKRWAVVDILIEEGEADCELEYKVIKGRGSEEPYAWTAYDDHFTLNQPGDYQIVARAKKEGKYSELVYCSEFTIEACAYDVEYPYPTIEQFTYPTAPATVEGGDITIAPTLRYSQGTINLYTDGTTQASSGRATSGATLSFSLINPITGVSIDSETGVVTVPANSSSQGRRLGWVAVGVTMHEKSANQTIEIGQDKKNKIQTTITWNPDPRSSAHTVGDSVAFGATASSGGAVTFKDGSNNPVTSPITLGSTSTVLKYFVEETEGYLPVEGQITINAIPRVLDCIYALSTSGSALPPSTIEDITSPDSAYNSGIFTNNQVLDCTYGGSPGRFKMSWFAVPSDKSLAIKTVEEENLTGLYTPTIIGQYKVYIQTGNVGAWTQNSIKLTIS